MAIFVFIFSAGVHADPVRGTVYADVNGLVCDFCARAIEKMFKRQEAVEAINVDLDTKVITIYFREGKVLDEEKIVEIINDSGYDVRQLRYGE